jgi:hypothetical protein
MTQMEQSVMPPMKKSIIIRRVGSARPGDKGGRTGPDAAA